MTIEVEVGTILRDNDPRNHGREVKVIAVVGLDPDFSRYALYRTERVCKIRLDRIHQPGYKGARGWTIVANAQVAAA